MFSFFNNELIRRYTVAFGSFFDKIEIRRSDPESAQVQRMIVPLSFGPKERWFVRLTEDPTLNKGVAQIVPRIAFELKNIQYDGTRKLNTLDKMAFGMTSPDRHLSQLYVGVPYTLNYELSILTKLQTDGLQIVEQILPFFTPDLTFKMVTIPVLGLMDTIPLVLTSVSQSDSYEGDFEHRRVLIWTLSFAMKAWIYGPTRTGRPIREVVVDIYNAGDTLLNAPEYLSTEQSDEFINEEGTGHLVSEVTANTYLSTPRVARIDAVLDPIDQDQTSNPSVIVTLEETSQDVKRNIILSDESV